MRRVIRAVTVSIVVTSYLFGQPQQALAGGIKLQLRGGDFENYRVIALSKTGAVVKTATVSSNNSARLSGMSGNFSLQVLDSGNRYAGPAVANCSRTLRTAGCKLSNSKLGVGFSGKQNVGSLVFKKSDSGYFKTTVTRSRDLLRLKSNMTSRATLGAPLGNARNLGRGTSTAASANLSNPADGNRDGVPDVYAADDDGDTIIDNYDTQDDNPAAASASAVTASEVRVFSNLKLPIESSLNANTGTSPSVDEVDSALSNNGTLAISVVGDAGAGDTTELDCGQLNYCRSGGTGHTVNGFISFPDGSDADSDGLGEITAGGTGDFQLQHGATSDKIGAGDTYLEIVTGTDSSVTKVPGMLNFVFNTTPALKSLEVQGGATYNVVYPATNSMLGSTNNCFQVPSAGNLIFTITGWRPQRPGNDTLGEASFVDIGKARYTIDIPNLPCTGSGGCSGIGPGNCATGTYSTTDPNLAAATSGSGLQDSKADADADANNTYVFTLDLTSCLGSTSFSSGEKLFLDLQAVSSYGDNAAQKFCVERQ